MEVFSGLSVKEPTDPVFKDNNDFDLMWATVSGEKPSDVLFSCMWGPCHNHFDNVEQLESHMNEHSTSFVNAMLHSQATLTCQIRGCGILVTSAYELSGHLKMHIFHAQKQNVGLPVIRSRFPNLKSCNFPSSSRLVYQGDALVCEWNNCLQSFVDINLYVSHLADHINDATPTLNSEGQSQFWCLWGQDCDMKFKHKSSLRAHIHHHSGDKICACPFCGVFFANNTKLLDHVSRRQKGDPHFFCFFCQKTFKTERLLKGHCQRHLRSHKCSFCSMAMDSAFDLQRHIATVHIKIRNHFCDVCKKGFYQKSDLTKHMSTHNQDLLFECQVCDKKYRWEKQLKYHAKSHEKDFIETPYLCHMCELKYRRGSALSEHFAKKHCLKVPEGFSRFQYKKCSDGLYRLQTKRWLSKQLVMDGAENGADSSKKFTTTE